MNPIEYTWDELIPRIRRIPQKPTTMADI